MMAVRRPSKVVIYSSSLSIISDCLINIFPIIVECWLWLVSLVVFCWLWFLSLNFFGWVLGILVTSVLMSIVLVTIFRDGTFAFMVSASGWIMWLVAFDCIIRQPRLIFNQSKQSDVLCLSPHLRQQSVSYSFCWSVRTVDVVGTGLWTSFYESLRF